MKPTSSIGISYQDSAGLQIPQTGAVDENGLNPVYFAFHVKQGLFGVRNVI
jgi:hypothetical protein